MNKERVPPHNIESEMALLGSCLLGEGEALDEVAGSILASDFYRQNHGTIYDALVTLHSAGTPVDIITLKNALQQTGELESVGGIAYLMQLCEIEFTTANVAYYAKIVRDKAQKRRFLQLCSDWAKQIYADEGEAVDLLATADRELANLLTGGESSGTVPLAVVAEEVLLEIQQAIDGNGAPPGLQTGLIPIDKVLGGFRKRMVTVIAADTGMGKTGLAITVAWGMASLGYAGLYHIAESDRQTLERRAYCMEAKVEIRRLERGRVTADERDRLVDAACRHAKMNLWINDVRGLTPTEIRRECKRLHRRHPLDFVIIDHLHEIAADPGYTGGDSERRALDHACDVASIIAKELDVAVILLAQLNRDLGKRQDKRPVRSDLKSSGGIEQKAFVILFPYRPTYYTPPEEKGVWREEDDAELDAPSDFGDFGSPKLDTSPLLEKVELIVAKNRGNAWEGILPLAYDARYGRFENPVWEKF